MLRCYWMGFFEDYFVNPVSMHSGYNIVNTAAYAVVAIAISYALFRLFERLHVAIDWKFFAGLLPFVLLGSTLRTITDSINYGIIDSHLGAPFFGQLYQLIKASHLYDYGFLTVSPGIYLVTASIFLAAFLALYFAKKLEWLPYVGLGLWLPICWCLQACSEILDMPRLPLHSGQFQRFWHMFWRKDTGRAAFSYSLLLHRHLTELPHSP